MKKAMDKKKLRRLVLAALFAALCCVATMLIPIPSFKGYINLGDAVVLVSSWVLGPAYGFAASAIGSSLADVFSGYVIYAPATFFIKGLMAVGSYYVFNACNKKTKPLVSRIAAGVVAELIMSFGYFIYELALYGFTVAVGSWSGNIIQGSAGIIVSILVYDVILERIPAIKKREI